MRTAIFFLVLAPVASAAGACHMIDSDHIYVSDLAAAMPAFSVLDPSLEVGLSPLPGITRVFHTADLLRIARDNSMALPASPGEICFERSASIDRTPAATAKLPAARAPLAVKRGDKVTVTVLSGDVVLHLESEAESGGRPGDNVVVRNPENGTRFAARVEDVGKVIVKK